MTKISDIYDAIVDVIEAELPAATRLPNPYVIEKNTYLHLKDGFGVGIGPGVDTERYTCDLVTWQRVFSLILIKQVVTTQNNTGVRETIEKGILDDHDKLRKAFFINNDLSGNATKTIVAADGGVSFVDAELAKFLSMQIDLTVEYQESPNT